MSHGRMHDKPRAQPREREAAHILAMLALQSERYQDDPEYREAADNVLAYTLRAEGAEEAYEVERARAVMREADMIAEREGLKGEAAIAFTAGYIRGARREKGEAQ